MWQISEIIIPCFLSAQSGINPRLILSVLLLWLSFISIFLSVETSRKFLGWSSSVSLLSLPVTASGGGFAAVSGILCGLCFLLENLNILGVVWRHPSCRGCSDSTLRFSSCWVRDVACDPALFSTSSLTLSLRQKKPMGSPRLRRRQITPNTKRGAAIIYFTFYGHFTQFDLAQQHKVTG